jgi:hypothetical protein
MILSRREGRSVTVHLVLTTKYRRKALPPLKTIATDLPSQDIDEELNSTIHPRPPWETLPTMYDLPSENPEEPGLPDEFHDFQPQLLRETCQSSLTYPRRFSAGRSQRINCLIDAQSWCNLRKRT